MIFATGRLDRFFYLIDKIYQFANFKVSYCPLNLRGLLVWASAGWRKVQFCVKFTVYLLLVTAFFVGIRIAMLLVLFKIFGYQDMSYNGSP